MDNQQNHQALDVNAKISSSEAFIKKNKKKIICAAAAVVILAGGAFAFLSWKGNRNDKGQDQLGMGVYVSQGLQGDSAALSKALAGDGEFKGFTKVADTYSHTDASNLAHAYAGECYAQLGKYKEAIAELEEFTPGSDAVVSPRIVMLLAKCYEYENQMDKAVETYKKAAKLAKNEAVSPDCLYLAALILKSQKKNAEAKELLEQLKEDYPTASICIPQQIGPNEFNSPEVDAMLEAL